MLSQVTISSATKNEVPKVERKHLQGSSQSSKSDRSFSASKENKAFGDSLRKNNSTQKRMEGCVSPLKKIVSFGKNDKPAENVNEKIYKVDITKKIKRVQSPFAKAEAIQAPIEQQDQQVHVNTRILVSQFETISEKVEESVVSSNDIQKNPLQGGQETEFENLALKIKDVVESFKEDFEEKCEMEQEKAIEKYEQQESKENKDENIQHRSMENEKFLQNQNEKSSQEEDISNLELPQLQESSLNVSSRSRESCDEKRLKKKQKKHMIRKEKRRIAKQMKEKYQNITNFVNELHKKEPHTKRKTLICELTQHLYEEKFRQLRNELKKLI